MYNENYQLDWDANALWMEDDFEIIETPDSWELDEFDDVFAGLGLDADACL